MKKNTNHFWQHNPQKKVAVLIHELQLFFCWIYVVLNSLFA